VSGSVEGVRLAVFTDTYGPEINGVVRSLQRLSASFCEAGGQVRVFSPGGGGATDRETDVVRWPAVALWSYPQLRLAPPLKGAAVAELRRWKADLVHSATPFGVGLAGRAAAATLGLPFVTSYHTQFSSYTSYYGLGPLANLSWSFLRWFHNGGRRTFAPTEAVLSELCERSFERLSVWGRGVDPDRFSPVHRCATVRARCTAGDRPIVLYVGRLAAEKGLATGLRAAAEVLRRHPDSFRLAVVGDGPFEAVCRRIAPAGTLFTGRLEGMELSRLYASADVFLFPSGTDSFGNVQLEAMASGLPVLAADCAVNREVLGPAGVYAGEHDVDGFARALERMVLDAGARGTLGATALDRSSGYTWPAIFNRLFAEYGEVLEASRRSRSRAA